VHCIVFSVESEDIFHEARCAQPLILHGLYDQQRHVLKSCYGRSP